MLIEPIASSSKGNAYIISDGTTTLLIEIGVSLNTIREKADLTCINGCLISHEHQDHSKYIKDIVKYTNVYLSSGTLEALQGHEQNKDTLKYYSYNIKRVKAGTAFKVGTFKITPFETEHDAKEPLGFYLFSESLNESVLFATDTYFIRNRFKNLNYIMVECNYALDILQRNLESKRIDYIVAKRLLRSHMELNNLKIFLKANDLSKVKRIYLLHLSSSNADHARFKTEIEATTGIPTIVCKE